MADVSTRELQDRIILKLSVTGEGWAERIKQQIRDWAAAGMGEDEILKKITKELSPGGTIFDAMMGNFANITGEATDYVSIDQVHEEWKGANEWTWITIHDDNRCDDCAERDGQTKTWEQWEALGLPGLGATICGWRCRCDLEPQDYVEKVGEEEISSGIEKAQEEIIEKVKEKAIEEVRRERGHMTTTDPVKVIQEDMDIDKQEAKKVKDAVYDYSEGGYQEITKLQRNEYDKYDLEDMGPEHVNTLKEQEKLIEDYLDKAPPFPTGEPVYRGVYGDFAERFAKEKPGTQFSFGSTSSFSSDYEIAIDASGGRKDAVIFELIGEKNRIVSITNMTKTATEAEVLGSKTMVFEIVNNEVKMLGEYEIRVITIKQMGVMQ